MSAQTHDAPTFARDVPAEVLHALGGKPPTEQQWAAIAAPLEPAVLIAGAGSGKTAVMAARIVWLILGGHAKPSEILGLTFTNKAADNLLQRVRRAVEPLGLPEGEEPVIATYHGFAASLIGDYGLRVGLEPGAALMSEAQAWQLCAELFSGRTYEALQVRSLYHVASVRHLADECANHLVSPRDVIEHDHRFLQKIDEKGIRVAYKVLNSSKNRIELAGVVEDYQRIKRDRQLLDYGDQIAFAYELAGDEAVQADFRARFKVALLDEFQDTNHAQAQLLRRLMPAGYPVMAVGDPDQNIYAWRGASLANLLHFPEEFPKADGTPAATMPLVVNFRSGSRILSLANALIDQIPPVRRPPGKVLEPYEHNGVGEVRAFCVDDQLTEAERIAEQALAAREDGTPWREMAILPRKKRLFGVLVEVFRRREIPLEVIGLGGLLRMPEVIDLVAVLRVLNDPMRNVALARLLRGPRWRIGHRDLAMIARHAADRNRHLREALADAEAPGDVAFSLAEALGTLEEVEGLSDEARARLQSFQHELASLRAEVAPLPLEELVARALDWLGLPAELAASPSLAASSIERNLANFLDRVAAFEPLDGEPTLGSLIEWLDAIESSDEEIEASQPTEHDSVKLMTIHQAKGLEFDVVFIPGLASGGGGAKIFPDTGRQPNPAENARYLPFEFRGDRDVLPDWDNNLAGFKRELTQRAMEEERRLLYVAVTRARRRLIASAAHWYEPSGMSEALKYPMGPSEFWREIASFEGVEVLEHVEEAPEPNPLIARRAERAAVWPQPARRGEPDPLFPDGTAAAVARRRAEVTPDLALFAVEDPPSPAAPGSLPVSALVTYKGCPKRFAWSYVRPLPRRSSAAARIGTKVHAWIEQQGRGLRLFRPDEFEEIEPSVENERIAALKAAFKASRFAGLVPVASERPFALLIGDFAIHGRIDAIFDRPGGGWEIVDFKTGRAPGEPGSEALQLDLYALAAQEIWGKVAEELTLTFAYFGSEEERSFPVKPAEQLRAEIGALLDAIAAGSFEPAPSGACSYCDFLRDCAAGQEFVASTS